MLGSSARQSAAAGGSGPPTLAQARNIDPPFFQLCTRLLRLLTMEGLLFRYGPAAANVAFMSGRHPRHVVLVGGLTDGLLFAGYCRPLAARLDAARWSLVQALLSSSHAGYGTASLDQDAQELHRLAVHLKEEYGSQGLVIVGHSTGCQDALRYCQRHRSCPAASPLQGVVLQAPVSDFEWLASQPGTAERTRIARELAGQGRGEDIAFRLDDVDGAPVTARRWLSLAEPRGDDDFFSAHLSDAELAPLFAPLAGLPTLVLLSGAEEYVPAGMEHHLAMGSRLVQVMGPRAQLQVVEGATHALNGKEEEGAQAIAGFVAALGA